MLDPRLLDLFVHVAEERSFGRAAERLNLAQSTVSAQIRRLEDTVGAPLLTRHKRAAVQLTDVGRLFLAEARDVLDRLERAERYGRMAARGLAGPLAVGYIFSALPSGVLPALLRVVRHDTPLVRVAPQQAETPEQIAAVAERRLDIGLIRPRSAYPDGVRAQVIHREPLLLLLGADDPLAAHPLVPAVALRGRTFLLPQFNERAGLVEKLERLAATGGFAMPEVIRTNDFVSAAGMAAAGYGLVLAPASLARLGVEGLVARRIAGFDDALETALIWHDRGSAVARRIGERLATQPLAISAGAEAPPGTP